MRDSGASDLHDWHACVYFYGVMRAWICGAYTHVRITACALRLRVCMLVHARAQPRYMLETARVAWHDATFLNCSSGGDLVCAVLPGVVDEAIRWEMQTAEGTRPF